MSIGGSAWIRRALIFPPTLTYCWTMLLVDGTFTEQKALVVSLTIFASALLR